MTAIVFDTWSRRQRRKYWKLRRSQARRGLSDAYHRREGDLLCLRFDRKNPRPAEVAREENRRVNAELMALYPEIYGDGAASTSIPSDTLPEN